MSPIAIWTGFSEYFRGRRLLPQHPEWNRLFVDR
jgi:hypothetical protein